jgi:hypothetical protein
MPCPRARFPPAPRRFRIVVPMSIQPLTSKLGSFRKSPFKTFRPGTGRLARDILVNIGNMPHCSRFVLFFALSVVAASGQQPMSFADKLYPVFQQAGCRMCHNPEGVASPTRLHFPEEGASNEKVEAFGKSLVELVDRDNPDNSILLRKPTNRIKHSGGERIKPGSPEETLLKQWIGYLATLSGPELAQALQYKARDNANSGQAPEVVLRRLTNQQYNNTVRDLLQDPTDPANQFPPEDFVNGFKNQYQSQSLSPIQIEAYSVAAERLAVNAFRRGDSRHLIPCSPGPNNAGCRLRFIQTFGRRAFRRPLEPEEVALYDRLFKAEGDFQKGAATVIEAVLQSPSFLFWMEQTRNPKWKPYAVASRLAYFIWDTMPDDALLETAARGELNGPEGIGRVARRMLADPRARQGLDDFVSQWLRFDRVLTAARDRRFFPLFSHDLAFAMIEETKHFMDDLVWNDRDFMDAFTANYGFVNSDLAAIYKVPAPAHEYARVEFPEEQQRSGLLGEALFLTLTSKLEDTAPTGRGLFVREQFLCQHVPPPPPGVDTNLPSVEEARPMTNRERLAAHTTDKACASCHHLIDPIGFGLEKFDAIGVYREKQKMLFYPDYHGAEVKRPKPKEVYLDLDTAGLVAGLPEPQFSSARQLGALLARTPQCQECVVKQLFRYMSGRQDTPADILVIHTALNDFRESGFHYKALVVSLVKQWDSPLAERNVHVASNYQAR